jgi:hypothetical protein
MKPRWSIPQEAHKQAYSVARLHLARFRNRPNFMGVSIRNIYPLLDHKGEQGTFFEVVFCSEGHNNHGFAIISISRDYPPIGVFSFEGIAPRDYFTSRLGHRKFDVALYGTFYLVAEDDDGRPIATLGDRPPVLCTKEHIHSEHLKGLSPHQIFKKCYGVHHRAFLERTKGTFDGAWKLADRARQGGESSGEPSDYPSTETDLPPHNYQEILAKHWELMPHYRQLAPNEGANRDHDFSSGCGATAWMNLIGYYDNTITPDLLRGNYDGLSGDVTGGASAYKDNVLVALSEYIGVHADGDEGKEDWDDMFKGFDFIKARLHHDCEANFSGPGLSKEQILETVYSYLCLPGVPSIVALPDHYVVAYGVMMNQDDASDGELSTSDHYLRVNWGAGSSSFGDVFIPYDLADKGVWTLSRIDTSSEITVEGEFSRVPTFVDLGRSLMMGSRSQRYINFHQSQEGRFFNYRFCIESIGTSNPSFAVEPSRKYLYVAWSDGDGSLGLAKMDIHGASAGSLKMLQAPPDQSAQSGPAIAVQKGRLYYVWGGNIASIPLDWLDRYAGNIWPSGPGETHEIEGGQSEWRIWDMYGSIGSPGSFDQPTLISHFDRLYLGTSGVLDNQFVSMVSLLDDHGNVILNNSRVPVETKCGHHLCSFGGSLYGSNDSTVFKIQSSPEPSWGQSPNPWLHSTAFLWPYGIDAKSVVLGSFGTVKLHEVQHEMVNMGPCLFSSWLDSNQVVHIRYHSVYTWPELDMTGWIL